MSSNYYNSANSPDGTYRFERDASNNAGLQEINSSSSLNDPLGEIQHTSLLVEQISMLHLDEDSSDLTLVIDDLRLPVHRILLAARSNYFRAMLYGGMRESSEKEVTLIDASVEAFKVLLKYIYTGRMQLKTLDFNLVLEILGLVHKYGFSELEVAIPEYLKSVLKINNVCAIFTVAHHYSILSLMAACLDFIDNNATELLKSQAFIGLSAQSMIMILSRNSFYASELEIFNVIKRWIEANPEYVEYFPSILMQVRLPLIKMNDLFGLIRDSGLITPDQILDAIKDQNTLRSSQLNYRGFLLPNINIAMPLFGAKVITGDFRTALLSNQNAEEDSTDRTYAKHLINPRDSAGIMIELGKPFIINNFKLHLMDRDQRAYSYYIEASVDRVDWIRLIDHTQYLCRSKQNLFFEERVIKFIRIIGTHSSVNNTFQLGSFEALYTTEKFEIDYATTLQIPKTNVATVINNAVVIEGVSRSRNALLNGDTTNYDWDNGYTCHQIGSGALVIQLSQPYIIDTMRLLLWDCDDRCYSLYIEVSADQIKWTRIAELTECRSWQFICFNRIPVVFIKICGTFNSVNEVFHCVHFECPAMEINAIKEKERLQRLRRVISANKMEMALEAADKNIRTDKSLHNQPNMKKSNQELEGTSLKMDQFEFEQLADSQYTLNKEMLTVNDERIKKRSRSEPFDGAGYSQEFDRNSLPPSQKEDN